MKMNPSQRMKQKSDPTLMMFDLDSEQQEEAPAEQHKKYIPLEYQTGNHKHSDDPFDDCNDTADPSSNNVNNPQDPYDFTARYIQNQKTTFRTAVNEIKNGRKETHWFWFVLPTSPWVVNGVEQGSRTNRYFCLRSDDEVSAYLEFPTTKGVNLRNNYLTILTELKAQLTKKKTAIPGVMGKPKSLATLFPPKDVPKAISSFILFQRVAQQTSDPEIYALTSDVLRLHETNANNLSLFQKIRTKLLKSESNNNSKSKANNRKSQTLH